MFRQFLHKTKEYLEISKQLLLVRSDKIKDKIHKKSYTTKNLFHNQIINNNENSLSDYIESFKMELPVEIYIKYCSKCGYDNNKQVAFCPECGNKLK